MVYKVPPGDIFANNYGREHMKSSNQVRSDIQLPLSYENENIKNNKKLIFRIPWPRQHVCTS